MSTCLLSQGTVIRVFSVPDGRKLYEFRRGMKRSVFTVKPVLRDPPESRPQCRAGGPPGQVRRVALCPLLPRRRYNCTSPGNCLRCRAGCFVHPTAWLLGLLVCLFVCLFILRCGRGRERGRERIPSRLHALSTGPDTGLDPVIPEIMT